MKNDSVSPKGGLREFSDWLSNITEQHGLELKEVARLADERLGVSPDVLKAVTATVEQMNNQLRELSGTVFKEIGPVLPEPRFYHQNYVRFNTDGDYYYPVPAKPDVKYFDGKSPHYDVGYESTQSFRDHFEKINDVKAILSLDVVIRDNLRINHAQHIGDGQFSTDMYVLDPKKAAAWPQFKAMANEFFGFMNFEGDGPLVSVNGGVLTFNWTYFDDKNLPIAMAAISFTKMDDNQFGVRVTCSVSIENSNCHPHYAKDLIDSWLGFYGEKAPANVFFRKIYWQYGNPSWRQVKSSRLGDPAYDSFYPWITDGIESYMQKYLESKASVLLLIGLPGTGKSTLIRSMRTSPNVRMFLADSEPLAREEDPFEKLAQLFHQREYSEDDEGDGKAKRLKFDKNVLIVEDADEIIGSRSEGNKNMTRLLSLTNGLDNSEQVKVIISTNLDNIDKVDKALLRPGRCFDILCFRNLTIEEAQKARADIGKEPRDFGKLTSVPLSVALSDDQTSDDTIVTPRYAV